MNINEVFLLLNYVANKNLSGKTFRPADFNILAKVAQLDFISKRLGNVKLLGPSGTFASNFLASFPSNRYIDIATPIASVNGMLADSVHPSKLGNIAIIAKTIYNACRDIFVTATNPPTFFDEEFDLGLIKTVTTTYTVNDDDSIILGSPSGGSFTITMDAAVTAETSVGFLVIN